MTIEQVITFLRNNPNEYFSVEDISRGVGLKKKYVYYVLRRLLVDEKVLRIHILNDKKRWTHYYTINGDYNVI